MSATAFDHDQHADAKDLDCTECHGDDIEGPAKLTREDCATCHEKRGRSSDCAGCHVAGWGETIPPPSHTRDWLRRHGARARAAYFPNHGEDCSTCHTDDTCAACHRALAPESHTTTWRERSHGIYASSDRDACLVCHMQDGCARCHAETRPSSHRASWGAPANRHCASCHVGEEQASGCAACHPASTAAHAAAPAVPVDGIHVVGARAGLAFANCGNCHVQPHPGSPPDCFACHR